MTPFQHAIGSGVSQARTRARSLATDPHVLASRRQMRYSNSMQALSSALQHCASEPSQRELQIRSLECAIDVLSSRARDAHERVAQLRTRLTSRDLDLDPVEHRALQKEYWVVQQCSALRGMQLQDAQANLKSLRAIPIEDSLCADLKPSTRHQMRRKANLVRFLSHSSTRVPLFRLSVSHRPSAMARSISTSRMRSIRPRTLSQPSIVTSSAEERPYSTGSSLEVPGDSMSTATGTSFSVDDSKTDGILKVEAPVPQIALSSSSIKVAVPNMEQAGYGMVTIYDTAAIRTEEDILSDLNDVAVPEYAHKLLNELGHSIDTVSLDFPRLSDKSSVHSGSDTPRISPSEDSITRHRSPLPLGQEMSSTTSHPLPPLANQASINTISSDASRDPNRANPGSPLRSLSTKRFSLSSLKDHVNVLSKVRKRVSFLGQK